MGGFVDPTANAPVVLDAFHARIHEGTAWHWSHRYMGVASGAFISTIIDAKGTAHFRGWVEGNGQALVDFLEVGSYTDGTSTGAVNRNGFKTHVSSLIIHHTASLNVTNGNIVETLIAGGEKNQGVGGETGDFAEFLLPAGTYSIRLQNWNAGTADYAVQLQWYEPGNAG